MERTPYELRFDLLAMARDHLLNKFHAELDLNERKLSEHIPTFPSDQEIFNLAESLKQFVDKK